MVLDLAGLLFGVEMIVYIDGENVIHQLVGVLQKNKKNTTRDAVLKFPVRKLLENILHTKDFEIRYYTTALRLLRTDPILEKRSRNMMKWSEKWANNLTSQNISIIKAGKLKVREGEVCPRCGYNEVIFREKGVDVRLAVDMVVDSTEEKQLVLWSSDADLLPAVQIAKHNGARVKNIAHKDFLNFAVAKQCGEWQIYDDKNLKVKRAKKK